MSKTWVICIDGTWNEPSQKDKDPITGEEDVAKSNVARAWEAITQQQLDKEFHYGTIAAIAPLPHAGDDGEAVYLTGIGTTGTVERLYQGATGSGTSERIRDAYRFLAQRYSDGDRIFVFGFSRGAYAVRSLAGLIDFAGLPHRRRALKEEETLAIYDSYRSGSAPALNMAEFGTHPVPIEFVGVWDTVGALAFGSTFRAFHRISPGNVKAVAHALALDEVRSRFAPSYWDAPAGATTQVDEVWFAGAHTNVGGGYADANLSNISFFWLMRAARNAGLMLDLRRLPGFDNESPNGVHRDSYEEFYRKWKALGDAIIKLGLGRDEREARGHQRVHESVFERMDEGPRTGATPYVPAARLNGGTIQPGAPIEPWGAF